MNMKKIDLVVLICAFFVGGIAYIVNAEMNVITHAGPNSSPKVYSQTYSLPTSTHAEPFSVGGTTTDLSNPIDISNWDLFSVQAKCTSASATADYQLQTETSNWVSPSRFSPDETLWSSDTSEDWTAVTNVFPQTAPFLRFRFTGVNSNPTDTKCWLEFTRQRSN